jgi:hypothetical protein
LSLEWQVALEQFTHQYFKELLTEAHGSVTRAAHLSGCQRSEIYTRIRRYGINVAAMRENKFVKIDFVVPKKLDIAVPASFAERAIYAKYAKYAEFSDYSEYAEFSQTAAKVKGNP